MTDTPSRPPLSPAAQAVLDAYIAEDRAGRLAVAAALRALADHQAPAWDCCPLCHWSPSGWTREELRNIAEELEGGGFTGSTH